MDNSGVRTTSNLTSPPSTVSPRAWRFLRDYQKAAHVQPSIRHDNEKWQRESVSRSENLSTASGSISDPWTIFFDFDRTLSVVHVFKQLSGWTVGSEEEVLVKEPHALTERGQVRRLCELGPAWTLQAFGGEKRMEELRQLLGMLRLDTARLIIVTRGYIGVVRKCLKDLGLLASFERVHGNVGEAYGKGTEFDLESRSFDLGPEVDELLGQPDEGNWGSKGAVVAQYLCNGTSRKCAVFVDDDPDELKDIQGLIPVIHVQGGGMHVPEYNSIYNVLGRNEDMNQDYGVASVLSIHPTFIHQKRSWWQRCCCIWLNEEEDPNYASDPAEISQGQYAIQACKRTSDLQMIRMPSNSRKPCVYDREVSYFTGRATTIAKVRTVQIRNQRMNDFNDSYRIEKELGRGGFGTTYRANEKASGRTVVVKTTSDIAERKEFIQLRSLTNPHVVRVYDCFVEETQLFIIMEFCAGGDLNHALQTQSKLDGVTVNWCAAVFVQVLAGVLYLHMQFKQQHNDIKPENILLERVPSHKFDVPRTMIADFGCMVKGAYGNESKGGDPRYCAFEVIKKGKISNSSDAWSLGITLYELLTGELPFLNHRSLHSWAAFRASQNGALLKKLQQVWRSMAEGRIREADCSAIENPLAAELTRALLQVEPTNRIKLLAARSHAFFDLAKEMSANQKSILSTAPVLAHSRRTQDYKLRIVMLALVASKLSGEHLNYYTSIWDDADEDYDGVLNMLSFEKLWASITFPDDVEKPLAEDIFHIIDLDDDGLIDFDEFVAFTFDMDRLDAKSKEQYFRSAFFSIAGPDGIVELGDFKGLFARDALPYVGHLFKEIDANDNGQIDFTEFTEYMRSLGD